MIAIDTNVVVRFLVNDEPVQARRAHAIIEAEAVLLLATVLLETEWVLRAGYGFRPEQIHGFFRALIGLPGVTTEDPGRIGRALDGYEAGLDFADALHVAADAGADAFTTFDRMLVRRAKGWGAMRAVGA